MIRPWPSDSHLRWMKSNVNEPGPLHRLTPRMSPIRDHAQHEGHENRDRGCSMTRDRPDRQLELDRVHSKSRACNRVHSKSRRRSKSSKCSKSRKRSKSWRWSKSRGRGGHEVHKPGVWLSQRARSQSRGHPEKDRSRRPPSTSSHSYEQNRNAGHATHPVPSKDEMSTFLKLKEEVTKQPQGYIAKCAKHIARSLTPDHEVVKCLVAFGENALKYATEVLATIEWGTQHWKLQESFPVPYVPRWLRMPELMQTTMPLRGELPLIPSGTHLEDIHICSPAIWAWIAVLLQYWQDHMSRQLYRGHFRQASDLANTLIRDINPWLSHSVRFGWNYVAAHATLWLDMRDQFVDEHHAEWEGQKLLMCSLNDLECNTEVIYRERLVKRENDKLAADSREAAAKELLPD